MKKITSVIALMLLFAVSAMAQKTVDWTTMSPFNPDDNASCYYVGIQTPGTEANTYTMTAFAFWSTTGYGAAARYTAICTEAPTADNGWKVPEEAVLAVSLENPAPVDIFGEGGEGYIDYTLSEGIELTGNTTYYMVFLESDAPDDGSYQSGPQRIRLKKAAPYPPGVMMGNGVMLTSQTPGFKATLETDAIYTVYYECIDAVDNIMITSGTFENVIGTITPPELEGYEFGRAINAETDEEVDLSQNIEADMSLTLYYNPLFDVTFRIVDEKGNELATAVQPAAYSKTVTEMPEELDFSEFYDYSEISKVVEGEGTVVEVTATMKENPIFKFSPSAEDKATYYTVTLKNQAYVVYNEASEDPDYNLSLEGTNPDNETAHWKFIGNPYAGFTIMNEAAGSLILGSPDPSDDGNTGGSTLAKMADAGTQDFETWFAYSSSHIEGGFYLFNKSYYDGGQALNMRNNKVAYWTTGFDSGSTFKAYQVLTGEEQLAEAQHLLEELTAGANEVQIGYPTADALSAFQKAVNDAAEALKNGGDDKTVADNLRAAIEAVKSPANTNYTPRTDVYYTITNARGSMVYDPEHAEDLDGDGNEFLWYSNSLDKDNANHQWGFIEVSGIYYMYNVGKKQFAGVTTSNPGIEGKNFFSNGTWMFSNAPSSVTLDAGDSDWVPTPNVRVRATSSVTGSTYTMSVSTSYTGPIITYDAVNDGGVPMTFGLATSEQDEEVTAAIEELLNDITPFKEGLETAINAANDYLNSLADYPIGSNLNEYTLNGDQDALAKAIADAEAALADENATKESLSAALAAINEAKDALTLSLNMPQAGMFLRITSTHGTYVSGTESDFTAGRLSLSEEADISTIFYFDGEKLLNFDTGVYANGRDVGEIGGEGLTYTFQESTIAAGTGRYAIRFNPDGNSLRYLWAWDSSRGHTDQNGSDADNCVFTLEEVTELPITMTEYDGVFYRAFSAPVAISSVNGASVCTVIANGDKFQAGRLGSTAIPANTGVLLIAETDYVTATIGEAAGALETGLQPLLATQAEHEGMFFGDSEGKIGFWPLTDTTGGFTAYFEGTEGIELEGIIDGIKTIDNELMNNGAIYNLQGQKVNKAQKGVFIQNGRKVVVK
ncbi:MAG: hypothetical protein IJ605_00290 [Prevotella sp.]|nr:hypothetical protein [Prevotella sp.]